MPDCQWERLVKKRQIKRERERVSKEISPLSLKGSWPRFIILAIVCLCFTHVAASSERQIQYSNSVDLAVATLASGSNPTISRAALAHIRCDMHFRCFARSSHPLHPSHPLPTHTHTHTL